jgi:uncharacterized integral membrane protein
MEIIDMNKDWKAKQWIEEQHILSMAQYTKNANQRSITNFIIFVGIVILVLLAIFS